MIFSHFSKKVHPMKLPVKKKMLFDGEARKNVKHSLFGIILFQVAGGEKSDLRADIWGPFWDPK